jgi:nitrogen regulatory protein P-II 1
MKKIEAIIREECLPAVLADLREMGYPGITVTSVQGHGRQKGLKQVYRSVEYTVDFLPKTKVEIITEDTSVDRIVASIARNARTGNIGDGKIWVMPVEAVLRVRTGETDDEALSHTEAAAQPERVPALA